MTKGFSRCLPGDLGRMNTDAVLSMSASPNLWMWTLAYDGAVVIVISRQAQTFSRFDRVTVFGVQTTGPYKGQTFIMEEIVLGISNIEGDE